MAVVINVAPGDPNANSYATVAEADAYHASLLYNDVWVDADVPTKTNALITATRLLDENIMWLGWPSSTYQVLGWPRAGAIHRTGAMVQNGVIPVALKWATAEFARLLIAAGTLPNLSPDIPSGLKSIRAGSVSLDFEPSQTAKPLPTIPPSVWSILAFLATGRPAGSISVPLTRT